MVKRIFGVLLLIVVALAIYLGYRHQQAARQLASGDVHCVGCMSPEEKARFDKQNAAEATANDNAIKSGSATDAANDQGKTVSEAIQTPPPEVGAAGGPETTGTSNRLPVSDSLSADPPDGSSPGGRGPYQWYRQGDLTWRLNTKTGGSCVAFATLDEWQKPIVVSHGCGRSS